MISFMLMHFYVHPYSFWALNHLDDSLYIITLTIFFLGTVFRANNSGKEPAFEEVPPPVAGLSALSVPRCSSSLRFPWRFSLSFWAGPLSTWRFDKCGGCSA